MAVWCVKRDGVFFRGPPEAGGSFCFPTWYLSVRVQVRLTLHLHSAVLLGL